MTWLRVCRSLEDHDPKAVIIPWWTVFWAPFIGFVAKYLGRRNITVLFLLHNVYDHETTFWKKPLNRFVLSQGSHFLVQSQEAASTLAALIPEAPIAVHPHPVNQQFPPPKGVLPRRARLELLFFGFVRPYKGLDVLLEAMVLLKDEDVFLTIAGEWWTRNGKLRRLLEDSVIKEKVEVIDRYINFQDAAEYFSRADTVVLPYRCSYGSSVVPLAYRYGRPVIATTVGGFNEIVEDDVSGRLVPPENPYVLAEVIREFLKRPPNDMREGIESIAQGLTWESLSQCVLDLVVG
jgi:glycosyltransferase involved in cell wall biosynthesis